MFVRLFLVFALLTCAPVAKAACDGEDLRDTLTTTEQAELDAALSDMPYPIGNHWRATRGDTTLHLIGTMHLGDPRLDAPVARLRPLVQSADLLLLEMTAEDEARLEERITADPSFLLMSDTTLPELLPEDTWQALSEAFRARGLPPFVAARFQPWYVSMLLAIPPCAMGPELAENGLDAQLEAIARESNVARAALEDVETIFTVFSDQPRSVQIDMMLSGLLDPQDAENLFSTLLASYFDEQTAEGWAVSNILAARYAPITSEASDEVFETIQTALLQDRNRAWLDVLRASIDKHDNIVVAVGAAHLPGQHGLLAALAFEGFALERRPF